MAEKDSFRGIRNNQEIDPSVIWRDTRTPKQKFKDFASSSEGYLTILGILAAALFLYPSVGEVWLLLAWWCINFVSKQELRLPFRIPKTSGLKDPGQPHPATNAPMDAEGITFFGNERITKKELWFNNSDMRTHILIFGSTGAGKALRKNELVHTPSGWVKNEDLKVGQLVSTPKGTSPITGIFPQGELNLFKVTFEDNREIDVSGDHLWEVHYQNWEKKDLGDGNLERAKVITTEELMSELEKGTISSNYYVVLSKEVQKPEQQLEIHSYEKGFLLGNQSASYKESYNSEAFTQSIPENYKLGSIKQRYQLIQGIMDTNASIKDGIIEFSTVSKLLAQDLAEIIRSLGGIVKISETNNLNYKLLIQHPEPQKFFSFNNKEHALALKYQGKDKLKLKITSVKNLNIKEDCQCIKIADKRGLFITKDYIVTHNTEALLSLAYNSLVHGSGLIYVDGKGENVLFTKIYAMARTMNREDDVLCVNYMTGSRDVFGPQEKKLSNTLNPFASGGSGGLQELLVSLMDDGGGGGDMWKGRAISLISSIMMALVFLRDNKEILLDVDTIREYLILETIIKLNKRKDMPPHIRDAIRGYLVSLPGFVESAPKQNETVLEQHGYLQMQFTKILGSLADQYGFIFKTNLGEVDFKDIVLNRRILVVLLPALEKSTDELANLGKIIIATLKQMMAAALGSTVEGTYAEVVETKPTTAKMPFMTVLDEYGYYAVKGSAVIPAQARSLGFSMIFAGQDLPAFEKAGKEEAASIVANCNIKICMKLEDPQSTFDLFDKTASEAITYNNQQVELNSSGLSSKFVPTQTASVQNQKRINMLDLKDQKEGEGHIFFKSAIVRAKMFYAAPPEPPHISMNYFVRVAPPDISEIDQWENGLNKLIHQVTNENKIRELVEYLPIETSHVDKMRELLTQYNSLQISESAFATVAALGQEISNAYEEKASEYQQKIEDGVDDEEDEEITIFTSTQQRESYINERYKHISSNKNNSFDSSDDDNEDDNDDDDEEDDENINIFFDEDDTQKSFAEIERKMGKSEEDSKAIASHSTDDMKKASRYPNDKPKNIETSEMLEILDSIEKMIDYEQDN